jgi:hypothetical protein
MCPLIVTGPGLPTHRGNARRASHNPPDPVALAIYDSDLPHKPIIQSECSSCNTMRDVDEGCETMDDNPHTICDQKSFNARCLERLVNSSDGTDYASGTFVWTLLNYYGT